MRKYSDPRLMPASELDRMGEQLALQQPGLYDELVAATSGEEAAILCTTSGTTSNPKLAMLSAGRLIRHCESYLAVDPKGPDDEYVSVLPLSWIMEQVYALGKALVARMRVNFVEEPETTMADLREIGPTFVLLAPRVWEQIAADVRARVMDASPLKRWAFRLGMRLGMAAAREGDATPIVARRLSAVPRLARPARLFAVALGRHRRRRAGSRHLPLLPGARCPAAPALRADRAGGRVHDPSGRRSRLRNRGHRRSTASR